MKSPTLSSIPAGGLKALMLGAALFGFALVTQAAAPNPVPDMLRAAETFLASLDDKARARATFEWQDEERLNWHFIPRERKGLPLDAMSDAQRILAHNLLLTGMSYQGYAKALTIMSLEQILAELENNPARRDSGKYFVSVFGKPGKEATWGWRVEGHHLSLNFTVIKGRHVSATPSFYGTNPGRVLEGPHKGLQTLPVEENLARRLVNSLDAGQKKLAIVDEVAPRDILTKADKKVQALDKVGIPYPKLNPAQQKQLTQLMRSYINRNRPGIAQEDWEKIEAAGMDKVLFAWAGGLKRGEGHYYRIQGPTFLLEYDNTQNKANHVHAVYRDFQNDFGADLLRQHYANVPHHN